MIGEIIIIFLLNMVEKKLHYQNKNRSSMCGRYDFCFQDISSPKCIFAILKC